MGQILHGCADWSKDIKSTVLSKEEETVIATSCKHTFCRLTIVFIYYKR